MVFPFTIIERTIPGQHIREYPHSINLNKARQETALQLAIKQYVPADRPEPIPANAVTIIAAHGTGFPKELYEPLWEDLYKQLRARSVPLRAIWMADVSNQGASGVLNENIQGDTTNWYDHSRDLLHMVNHFRDEFPRPIIGVAHSMGCAQLVHLSILHPRLLSTLILFEPVILEAAFGGPNPSSFAASRKDLWPSREKAQTSLRKSLQKWDPRVIDRFLEFGLRPVPTRLYNPDTDASVDSCAVTLTTSKHQESWSYSIANLEAESAGLDRYLIPDWDPDVERPYMFSRPECWSSMRNLPVIRPSVLWVFGEKSYLSPLEAQEAKMKVTGTGVGGSGGVKAGMVEKTVLKGGSHTLVLENVDWSAKAAADWVEKWFSRWLADEKFWKEYLSRRSDAEMLKPSQDNLDVFTMAMGTERIKEKL
ncbi:putative toxin biosynthesis protein [Talaromyces proteolyticus]|uniref:Toxin biosynthesis protein n=1 Tax=Talaromyces proteolyticus TaxID=1131652 RepID=A0AAD4KIM7_9EURO|nr:putative toxin biosynthesis protein [Talaromyces proteolyticus]KAH8691974.1 putative toxin biosynthesis protein [Talaromyces proteolyticus]